MPRCYVCSRLAVTTDPKTGDELCAFCWQQRKALREAVAQLQDTNPENQNEEQGS